MSAPFGDQLELRQAAEVLDVHYQTAYRWVRSGRLPATFVDNQYVVTRKDLDAFEADRHTPRAPRTPSQRRLDRQSDRVHEALMTGDEVTVRKTARTLVADGTSIVDLIELAFVPSLRRIGQAWHDGELSIWVEHRASAIVERTLGELSPNPRGRRRGTAVVAAVSGDQHSLPTTMAAVALRDANWHVHHLGANMPPDDLRGFCEEHDVDLAVISLTNPEVSALAEDAAERLVAAGVPTILGGPGRSLGQLVDEARAATTAGKQAAS